MRHDIVHVFNLFMSKRIYIYRYMYQHIDIVTEKTNTNVSQCQFVWLRHVRAHFSERKPVSPFHNYMYDHMHALSYLNYFQEVSTIQYQCIRIPCIWNRMRVRQVIIFSEDRPNLLWAVLKCIPVWVLSCINLFVSLQVCKKQSILIRIIWLKTCLIKSCLLYAKC